MRTREEQIEEMVQVNSAYLCHEDYTPDNLRMMLAAAISEAEERARAECAADTRRLEWLAECVSSIGGRHGEPLIWQIMFFSRSGVTDPKEIRAAIDAAMEGGNGRDAT
ncbi:hypothetical protein NBRC3280_1321 [Acetobacter pasteurianus NBRC 3280]|uniref:Uncharacterized protein n=1 Tax=Acetobacter pasteurianus NBRC 3278 TaxID=1226660 RepID=A0A401X3D2_ACEPA|nr:hypothetical protein [Acetobacter pasteurianus]GCD58820.1 hypothetical protein NBRC3277_1395 [Acetobacter pasteurianus NBRC 3277]GCD62313.1 hypothetical protein NBRC3278_1406 [Acetobacter pasteurianus NBRC 3278]GCD68686.1 hypothetical protein NBRC3280_1321 [Acetobacter pasteurianus NBRC 3280]